MQPKPQQRLFWIYGTNTCPYCVLAKSLVEAQGHKAIYIDVSGRPELCHPDWKTVPQCFEVSHYIGGYEDLITYLAE